MALIVQTASQPSSAAAPVTFTASYSGNTTAGNLLIAIIGAALSGAPTITTPTSSAGTWLPASNTFGVSGTALAGRLFYMPNNPGGFTGVVFGTLTAVNGVAVALYEVSGMNGVQPLDQLTQTQAYAVSTAISSGNLTPRLGGELWIGAILALTGNTLTAGNTPGAGLGTWTAGPAPTSTLGATNVQLQAFSSLSAGPLYPTGGVYALGGTNGASIASGVSLAAFLTSQAAAINQAHDAGVFGLVTAGGSGYGVGG